MPEAREALLQNVADRINELPQGNQIIAVDGVDTAGKTHFADELAAVLEIMGKSVVRASIDGFHNPRDVRYAQGKDSSEGYYDDSFNLDGVVNELLVPFKTNSLDGFLRTMFDVESDAPVEVLRTVAPNGSVLIFDGIFLMRPELERYWDFGIFLDISFEEVIIRAKLRDGVALGSDLERRYLKRYIPAQKKYLEEINPKSKVDIVIDNSDINAPFIVL